MKRIIWELADGRRKYSSKKGVPLEWNEDELFLCKESIELHGITGYANNFGVFGFVKQLEELGFTDIIECTSITLEDWDSPLTEGVLL